MRKLQTVKLKNTGSVYYDIYGSEGVTWAVVKDKSIVGYDTSCKEELGSESVRRKSYEFVIVCGERLDEKEVFNLEQDLNKEHKKLKVAGLKLARVDGRRRWLYCKHSPRWSRNSVAHSYLTTLIRKSICNVIGTDYWDDQDHLDQAKKVINIMHKKGLRVFGTDQHVGYDVGMVSLANRLSDGQFKPKVKNARPKPIRDDYDNVWDWEDAVDEWEDETSDSSNNYYDAYGDLDAPITGSAYKRLIDIFNGVKK